MAASAASALLLLLLAPLLLLGRRAEAGQIQAGIEQADNYGRNNYNAPNRPLQGWLIEDDKGASTALQAKWSTVAVTTGGLAENVFANYLSTTLLAGGIWLRGGAGTATNYACDGFGAGSTWLAQKMGAFKNFRRMTVDLLPYDGGAWGVTFNYVKKAGTPSATAFNPTFSYNLVFRSVPGQE